MKHNNALKTSDKTICDERLPMPDHKYVFNQIRERRGNQHKNKII